MSSKPNQVQERLGKALRKKKQLLKPDLNVLFNNVIKIIRNANFEKFERCFNVSIEDQKTLLFSVAPGDRNFNIFSEIIIHCGKDNRFINFLIELFSKLLQKNLTTKNDITDLLTDKNLKNPLMSLIKLGNFETVKNLLKLGVIPKDDSLLHMTLADKKDDEYIRLGHKIDKQGRLNILRLFLEHGLTPENNVESNRLPFVVEIALRNDVMAMKELIKYCKNNPKNDINLDQIDLLHEYTALKRAAHYGYEEMVKLLIECGANRDLQTNVLNTTLSLHQIPYQNEFQPVGNTHHICFNINNVGSFTPLMLTVMNGFKNLVPVLITRTNIDLQDKDGCTALGWAVALGHSEIVKMLLDVNANPNIHSNQGESPIVTAVRLGRLDILKLLAEKVDVDRYGVQVKQGIVSLVGCAAYYGQLKVLEYLLEINKEKLENTKIQSLLKIAIKNKHPEIVSFILDKYPSIIQEILESHLNNGYTYFEYACIEFGIYSENREIDPPEIQKMLSILELLFKSYKENYQGADKEFRKVNEFKLLIFAAQHESVFLVKFLVEHGVNPIQPFPSEKIDGTKLGNIEMPIPLLIMPKALATMQYLVEYCKSHYPEEFRVWQKTKINTNLIPALGDYNAMHMALDCAFRFASFEGFEYYLQQGAVLNVIQLVFPLCGFISSDTIPDFKRKLQLALEIIFKECCKKNGINLDEKINLSIQRFSHFLSDQNEYLGFKNLDLNLRFMLLGHQSTLNTNITFHFTSILNSIASELSVENGIETTKKKIRRILYQYSEDYNVDEGSKAQLSTEINKTALAKQELLEDVLMASRNFENIRKKAKNLADFTSRSLAEIQSDIERSLHYIQHDKGYYRDHSDVKNRFESNILEWNNEIAKIHQSVEKCLKTSFNPEDYKDLGALNKAFQEINEHYESLSGDYKTLLGLLTEVKNQLKTQQNIEHLPEKEKGPKQPSSKGKRQGKKKSTKPVNIVGDEEPQAVIPDRVSSISIKNLPTLVSCVSEFGQKLIDLDRASKDYLQKCEDEASNEREKLLLLKQQENKKLMEQLMEQLNPVFLVRGTQSTSLTFDRVSGISSKLSIADSMFETKQRQDLPEDTMENRILKAWILAGSLAQNMESAKKIHQFLLAKVASTLRDILFYNFSEDDEKNLSELMMANNNVIQFLRPKKKEINKKEVTELLKQMDPSLLLFNTFDRNSKKPFEITLTVCEQQLQRGIDRLRICQKLFVENNENCNPEIIKQALGAAFALIGNFASHLQKDFINSSTSLKAEKLFDVVDKMCQSLDKNLTLKTCIEIGKYYRHLNNKRIKDKETGEISFQPVLKHETWESRVQVIMARWQKPVTTKENEGFLPQFAQSQALVEKPKRVDRADRGETKSRIQT